MSLTGNTPEEKVAFSIGYLRGSEVAAFAAALILLMIHLFVKTFPPVWVVFACIGIGGLSGVLASILAAERNKKC